MLHFGYIVLMKNSNRTVLLIGFLVLLPALTAIGTAAQLASPRVPLADKHVCKSPVKVTVTVFLKHSSAVIPRAFVFLRGQGAKPFQLELEADSSGRATASVPCGYLDIFATAFNFAPGAIRTEIEQDGQFVAISLDADASTQY
jgi:hypothetical protein